LAGVVARDRIPVPGAAGELGAAARSGRLLGGRPAARVRRIREHGRARRREADGSRARGAAGGREGGDPAERLERAGGAGWGEGRSGREIRRTPLVVPAGGGGGPSWRRWNDWGRVAGGSAVGADAILRGPVLLGAPSA